MQLFCIAPHQAGDQVLEAVASEIKNNLLDSDFAARYGGEEIVVILDEIEIDEASDRANSINIRERVQNHSFVMRSKKEMIKITVSIGVSEISKTWLDDSTEEIMSKLIEQADSALYRAKDRGRNMVCVYELENG